jgi:hypothetical protein
MTSKESSAKDDSEFFVANLSEVITALRVGRKFILLTSGLGLVLAVVLALVVTPVYRARVTLLPQQSGTGSSLLLAQLSGTVGLPLSSSETMEENYGEIVRSDWMFDRMLDRTWPTAKQDKEVSLYHALGYDGPSVANKYLLVDKLQRSIVSFERDKLNGFMQIIVDFPDDPILASSLANTLADSLAGFVRNHHMNHAKEKRVYIENRLDKIEAELSAAEDTLTEFANTNRSYETSPTLLRVYSDLTRRVNAKDATWIELKRQLELARLEEHDTTVDISILDKASVPVRPYRPLKGVMVLAGTFLGFAAGLAVILLRRKYVL